MAAATIREWKVIVSLTRTLTWPIDDFEEYHTKEELEKYLKTDDGKLQIAEEFTKRMIVGYHWLSRANTDVTIDEIELKESEVKSTDMSLERG